MLNGRGHFPYGDVLCRFSLKIKILQDVYKRQILEKSKIRAEEIAGIGIDGQSWSAIAVDEKGKVLTNTPIWMDTRADDICNEMNEKIGADRIFAVSGNSLQPSYTCLLYTSCVDS